MANNQHARSRSQLALDLARLAKAIYSIVRAAIAAGLHGAAVAAVKEALLFLNHFCKTCAAACFGANSRKKAIMTDARSILTGGHSYEGVKHGKERRGFSGRSTANCSGAKKKS